MSLPSDFRYAKTGKTNNVFLVLCTWKPDSYVTQCALDENHVPEYINAEWHATALAIVKNSMGRRHLIFFDVDRKAERTRRGKIIPPPLMELFKMEKMMRSELWVNKEHPAKGERFCLEYAVRQMETWLSFGDMPWQGAKDPRLGGMEWEKITKA